MSCQSTPADYYIGVTVVFGGPFHKTLWPLDPRLPWCLEELWHVLF
ncbi:unnamed protein product, partial [Staurois parvus]